MSNREKYVLLSGKHFVGPGQYVGAGDIIELTRTQAINFADRVQKYSPATHGIGLRTSVIDGRSPEDIAAHEDAETAKSADASGLGEAAKEVEDADAAEDSTEDDSAKTDAKPEFSVDKPEFTFEHRGAGKGNIVSADGSIRNTELVTRDEASEWIKNNGGVLVDGQQG